MSQEPGRSSASAAPPSAAAGRTAAGEIEQTLEVSRQAALRSISLYRIWTFAFLSAASVATTLLSATAVGAANLGLLLFPLMLVYAILLRRRLVTRGASRLTMDVSALLDQVGCALGLLLTPPTDFGRTIVFHVAVPTLVLVYLATLLLGDARAAVISALTAAVAIPPIFLRWEPLNPFVLSLSAGAMVMGVLGVAAARQSRRNLELFARLQLLRRYLPPQAVERVLRDDPDRALSLGGRQLTVTILAADLRGFTSFAEKLTPGEVVRQLNAYHGTMLAEVKRHGGVLDKFIGDGTLVVFGLPEGDGEGPSDRGAAAAVACARDMLGALKRLNAERAKEGQPPLRMGLGVHTGPVVAGNIGAPGERLEFTVIGDAVNTASRLEGLTKEAGTPLLVSADAAALLPQGGTLRELPPMQAKGKADKLRVFSVAA